MKRILLIVFIAFMNCSLSMAQSQNDRQMITQLLDKQSADWNTGNIDAFMEGYWKSDSLMFVGSKGITYGWQKTLENYKKSYPDLATMGNTKIRYFKNGFPFQKNLLVARQMAFNST